MTNQEKHNHQLEALTNPEKDPKSIKHLKAAFNDFNRYRFEGLDHNCISNKYMTMNRISSDSEKIVVKVAGCHLLKTAYGYALILNCESVVFLKSWQVSANYYGNEVLLTKQFFIPKKWGNHEAFGFDDDLLSFDAWLDVAKQQKDTMVYWSMKENG